MVKLYRCRRLVNSDIYFFPVFRHEVIVTNESDWSKLYCNLMSFTIFHCKVVDTYNPSECNEQPV